MKDRRIRKSKEALKNALLELLPKKNLQEIQIKELCERADVNRSTFYSNYHNVDEILQDIYQDIIHIITSQVMSVHRAATTTNQDLYDAIYQAITYFQENDSYFSLIFSQHTNIRFEELLYNHYIAGYQLTNLSSREKYQLLYHIIGSFSIIRAWMVEKYPISAKEICTMLMEHLTTDYSFQTKL